MYSISQNGMIPHLYSTKQSLSISHIFLQKTNHRPTVDCAVAELLLLLLLIIIKREFGKKYIQHIFLSSDVDHFQERFSSFADYRIELANVES